MLGRAHKVTTTDQHDSKHAVQLPELIVPGLAQQLFVAEEAAKTINLPRTITDVQRIKHQVRVPILVVLHIGWPFFSVAGAVERGTSTTVTFEGPRLQRGGARRCLSHSVPKIRYFSLSRWSCDKS